jgi:hypothetical protein
MCRYYLVVATSLALVTVNAVENQLRLSPIGGGWNGLGILWFLALMVSVLCGSDAPFRPGEGEKLISWFMISAGLSCRFMSRDHTIAHLAGDIGRVLTASLAFYFAITAWQARRKLWRGPLVPS